ncbi:MAG: PAS domain S-box protein [Natrialbaceae archaeon]|nr:PAS domain S-box protein [Natrialbaceae archaeon]
MGVLRDISERRARNRELSQFETIVETVPLGIVVLDELAVVQWANERFSEATEWTLDEIIGKQFLEFVERGYFREDLVEQYLDHVRRLLSSEREEEVVVYDLEVQTNTGETRFFEAHTALLPLETGEYEGTVTAFLDITQRVRYQRELERQNDRLEQFARFVSHDLRNPSTSRRATSNSSRRRSTTKVSRSRQWPGR